MAQCIKVAPTRHVKSELKGLQASEGLPFRELLDENRLRLALERIGVAFRDRIYTPMTTLSAFLSQVIASKDSSCEHTVSRVIAERVANKKAACSTDTSSYCQARSRLPEEVIAQLARETGQELDRGAVPEWLFKGRSVKVVDGSTAEAADTPENQEAYPQSSTQKPGLGFPMLRIVAIFSLAVGTVLECAIGPCRGKKTGEQSLFRSLGESLNPGDILLGDCLYDCYRDIAQLKARGIDVLFGRKSSRAVDFRTGRRLGPTDHVVTWQKPKYDSNRFASLEEWEALPDEIEMREVRCMVRRKGHRNRTIIVVTTLLDDDVYTSKDVTDLFARRWQVELNLRSLKQVLGMRRLKCKTPAMVRKELWTYMLAYNLVRVRMAQAAAVHGKRPTNLSFTAAKTHIYNFAAPLKNASSKDRERVEHELLKAIANCTVGERPGRKEPRAVKKRQQKYSYLSQPRAQARYALKA